MKPLFSKEQSRWLINRMMNTKVIHMTRNSFRPPHTNQIEPSGQALRFIFENHYNHLHELLEKPNYHNTIPMRQAIYRARVVALHYLRENLK